MSDHFIESQLQAGVPASWDARTNWPACTPVIGHVRNQVRPRRTLEFAAYKVEFTARKELRAPGATRSGSSSGSSSGSGFGFEFGLTSGSGMDRGQRQRHAAINDNFVGESDSAAVALQWWW